MPDMHLGMRRGATRPGDMVIRINDGGIIGGVIGGLTKSEFVHGGLAVGQNRLIEVNGGLNPDSTGKGRILANIYMTDLMTDLKQNSYVVYRCNDAALAEQVAIEAYPFVREGDNKSWGYNLSAAVKSLAGAPAPETGKFLFIDENESVLAVAMQEKKNWFCTQWMVWMYNKTAEKMRKGISIGVDPKAAYPKALVDALDRCPLFTYQGKITGLSV